MNETEWYEIDQKVELKKSSNLLPNFSKGFNKHCLTFHLFCMAGMKVSKMQQISKHNTKSVLPNLAFIFRSFTELNKNLLHNNKFNFKKLTKFYNCRQY